MGLGQRTRAEREMEKKVVESQPKIRAAEEEIMAATHGTSTYRLDKVLQRELDGQGSLAHAAVAENHQFVQHHLARHGGRRGGEVSDGAEGRQAGAGAGLELEAGGGGEV